MVVTRVAGLVLRVEGLDLRAGERRLGWSLRVGRGGSVRGLGSWAGFRIFFTMKGDLMADVDTWGT